MGGIFEEAKLVMGSLGRHNNHSRYILDMIRSMEDDVEGSDQEIEASILEYSQEEFHDFIEAAVDFGKRPYWHRLWIVQEIALSRNILFVCGFDTVGLEQLQEIFNVDLWMTLEDHFYAVGDLKNRLRSERASRELYSIDGVLGDRLSQLHRNKDWTLDQVVTRFPRFDCADPLDRVYAILHMIKNRYHPRDRITPDYKVSTPDLAMRCLDVLILDRGSSITGPFLYARELCDVMKLNMQQQDIFKLVWARRQFFSELCAQDGAAIHYQSDGQTLQIVRSAKERSRQTSRNIVLDVRTYQLFRVRQSDDGGLLNDFDVSDPEIAESDSLSHTARSYAEEHNETEQAPKCLQLRPIRYHTHSTALLCSRAKPGDYWIDLDKAIGEKGNEHVTPCLIIRRCGTSQLFEIAGQGLVPAGTDWRVLSPYSLALRIYFDKEDFLALATMDLCDYHHDREAWITPEGLVPRSFDVETKRYDQPLQMTRLFTAVTSERFSSFAIEEEQEAFDSKYIP